MGKGGVWYTLHVGKKQVLFPAATEKWVPITKNPCPILQNIPFLWPILMCMSLLPIKLRLVPSLNVKARFEQKIPWRVSFIHSQGWFPPHTHSLYFCPFLSIYKKNWLCSIVCRTDNIVEKIKSTLNEIVISYLIQKWGIQNKVRAGSSKFQPKIFSMTNRFWLIPMDSTPKKNLVKEQGIPHWKTLWVWEVLWPVGFAFE